MVPMVQICFFIPVSRYFVVGLNNLVGWRTRILFWIFDIQFSLNFFKLGLSFPSTAEKYYYPSHKQNTKNCWKHDYQHFGWRVFIMWWRLLGLLKSYFNNWYFIKLWTYLDRLQQWIYPIPCIGLCLVINVSVCNNRTWSDIDYLNMFKLQWFCPFWWHWTYMS